MFMGLGAFVPLCEAPFPKAMAALGLKHGERCGGRPPTPASKLAPESGSKLHALQSAPPGFTGQSTEPGSPFHEKEEPPPPATASCTRCSISVSPSPKDSKRSM